MGTAHNLKPVEIKIFQFDCRYNFSNGTIHGTSNALAHMKI